jgi:uncharacterized membrane protein
MRSGNGKEKEMRIVRTAIVTTAVAAAVAIPAVAAVAAVHTSAAAPVTTAVDYGVSDTPWGP